MAFTLIFTSKIPFKVYHQSITFFRGLVTCYRTHHHGHLGLVTCYQTFHHDHLGLVTCYQTHHQVKEIPKCDLRANGKK